MDRGGKIRFVLLVMMAWGGSLLQGRSQPAVILESFHVFENQGKVYLRWVIIAGSTCDGIKIFRSVDGMNFDRIGEIPGVCGSPSASMPYEFTDESPVPNSINHYRLELGNSGFSETVPVELVTLNADGYQVRPNPSQGETRIYFTNPGNIACALHIISLNGHTVWKQNTRSEHFVLNTSWFPAGYYLFTIIPENNRSAITGRLLVVR